MGNTLTLSRDWLLDDVRRRFGISGTARSSMTIGAELELIPLHVETRLPVPIKSPTSACSADILRRVASRNGWCESRNGGDPSSWEAPGGARISFEPGGQIEVSSAPCSTATALIAELSEITCALLDTFERFGVVLETKGVDPFNEVERTELQLHRERYEKMTEYFESIGPSGVRMMRQTASVQINVEPGAEPLARWSLLNRLAPALVAMFANSSRYADCDTGHASYRSHLWRTLDPLRTGLSTADNVIESYCDFALGANWIFDRFESSQYQPFEKVMTRGATEKEWDIHLSTLFPEVRPRKYFELRSADMVDLPWIAAPIAMVAGICYDNKAASAASEILGKFDSDTLVCAGRQGLADAEIKTAVKELSALAMQGCDALGSDYVSHDNLEILGEFVDRYSANGRSPANDQ